MNIIIKYIKNFINKYIVSEDPNDIEVEECKKYIRKKTKRGRPKKKK